MEYEVFLKKRSLLGEGIWWDDRRQCLFWIDMLQRELHCLKGKTDQLLHIFPDTVGFCAPCEDGTLLVGSGLSLLRYDPDTDFVIKLTEVDADIPENRWNDAKCLPDGCLLGGTMNRGLDYTEEDGLQTGRLYLIGPDCTPKLLFSNMTVPNGIGASKDGGTVYHADTYTHEIRQYRYAPDAGTLTFERCAVPVPEKDGVPDGMTIAEDGTLFSALWDGGAVRRYDPVTGRELDRILLPVKHATCCCFGGPDLDCLFITTSSIDAPEAEYPLAGSIFMVKPGVRGRAVDRFRVSDQAEAFKA